MVWELQTWLALEEVTAVGWGFFWLFCFRGFVFSLVLFYFKKGTVIVLLGIN